ncbi:hypothetical protein [Nocardia sp. NPDC127526]|uniref:hypothetical protein n=1 Tax=Nocardia sp. NPDC127526 TaxID=3345393 RepID=UPI00362C66FF
MSAFTPVVLVSPEGIEVTAYTPTSVNDLACAGYVAKIGNSAVAPAPDVEADSGDRKPKPNAVRPAAGK